MYPAGGYLGVYALLVPPKPPAPPRPSICIDFAVAITRGEDATADLVRGELDVEVEVVRGLNVQVIIAGVRCAVPSR